MKKNTKNKKALVQLIIGIIFLILVYVLGINIDDIYNGNSIESQNSSAEIPEKFSLEEDSNLQILFFDVGQADSILVVDNGVTMLIDAGNREDGKLLAEYIKKLNITKIDYLVGTHAHEDHIGGMSDIINNFEIGTFFMPNVEQKKTRNI